MFLNFLKISLRTISKNKLHSIINFTGLTIGLVGFSLILKFVLFESSFDNFHTDKENIYRLTANGFAKVPDLWAPGLKETMPEVKEFVRLQLTGQQLFERNNVKAYEENGLFADSNFFNLFSFVLLGGDVKTALTNPNTIVLTESFAQKYFGNNDPIGENIFIIFGAEKKPFKITGIAADPPGNSHITFNYLVSMASNNAQWVNNWKWYQFYTYIKLNDGVQISQLESKIFDWLKIKIDEENYMQSVSLQNIHDIYLHSKLMREMGITRDASVLYIFSAIAILLLTIAVINFTNLNTASAFTRSKEVGVRKTTGASKNSILRRFIGESLLMSIISFAASLILVNLVINAFNEIINSTIEFNLISDWQFTLGLLSVAIVAGILGSVFPAAYLSSLDPGMVLKGEKISKGKSFVRKTLVAFQFSVSAFLIVTSLVISSQLNFIQSKDLGFEKAEQLILNIRNDDMRSKFEIIKERMMNHPAILNASISANLPGGSDYGIPYKAEGISDDQRPESRILVIDENFLDTYGMEIIAGRNFSKDIPTDRDSYLINETAAKKLGWDQPLSKRLSMPAVNKDWGNIIGVVKDFHYRNLHETIDPLVIMMPPDPAWNTYYTINFNPAQTEVVLQYVEQIWNEYDSVNPFSYFFLDDLFARQYESDQRDGLLVNIFTALAVFVACLGLFGLTSFTLVRKIKEIGVRKVLGASSGRIYWEVISEFLVLVVAANLIALPTAYYFMQEWLSNFAYKVGVGFGVFAFTLLFGVGMVLLSTALQTYRASNLNPADALRHE